MSSKTKIFLFILLSAFYFAFIFISIITDNFVIEAPAVINVFKLLPSAFSVSELKLYVWGALIGSITATGGTFYFLAASGANEQRIARGTRVVSGAALAKLTIVKNLNKLPEKLLKWLKLTKVVQIYLGEIPIPLMNEVLHFLIMGATGTGKTVAMDEMEFCCADRGDRLIIIDPNGHSLEHFGKPGDIVLNPFDARFPGWSIFNEFRAPYDYERFAKSVVPDATNTSDQVWHGNAQLLFSETCRALVADGKMSTQELLALCES